MCRVAAASKFFKRRGFTLIDVTVTVMITGIVAAVAAPKLANSIVRYKIDAAAMRIAGDLDRARRHAMTSGSNQAAIFTVASDTYNFPGMKDMNHSSLDYAVDLSETGYAATLVSVSFGSGGTDNTIIYDMYGRPDFGGFVVIQFGSEQRTITVNATTGKITVT